MVFRRNLTEYESCATATPSNSTSLDLGQLLDGLELRAESWERTAEYLRSGYIADGFIVEECSKPEEADHIAAHYRALVLNIRQQMEAQQ